MSIQYGFSLPRLIVGHANGGLWGASQAVARL